MRRFDPSGNPIGAEVRVNQTTSGYQAYPVIDMNDTGLIVVAWEGNGPGDDYGVFARRYQIGQFVTEGTSTTLTVVLNSAPTASVTMNLSISDISEISLNTATLTFTTANWSVPQTVTITGVQDWILDGPVTVSVMTSALVSMDPSYSGLNPDDVPVVVADSQIISGTFYSKGSLAVDTVSNWNSARDGSGGSPPTFLASSTWVIQNTHAMSLSGSSSWNVQSSGMVQIESGGSWTNTSSGTVTIGTLQLDNGGTYSHSATAALPGTIDLNGNLTAGGTAFTATGGSMYVAGDFSITAGTFTHNSGTIIADGGDADISTGTAALNNQQISKTTYLAMLSNLTVNGSLNIATGMITQDPSYNLTAGTLTIGANGELRNYGTGSLTLGGAVSVSGKIDLNGGNDTSCNSGSKIQIRSTVNGTQRAWSSSGSPRFVMVDVDVKDQGGSAAITCYGSTNSGGNGANWTIGSSCVGAPTAVTMNTMSAMETADGILIQWQTGYETNNLGFHVYREDAAGRVRLTPSLVAGSALFAGARTVLTAGRSYAWWDRATDRLPGASYWLEDVDLDGGGRMQGPIVVHQGAAAAQARSSTLLREAGQAAARSQAKPGALAQTIRTAQASPVAALSAADPAKQFWISGRAAVKLEVKQAGWYRVTRGQLLAAGLDPAVEPTKLQLYTDGIEQALQLSDVQGNHLWQDAGDYIEFYGIGLDRPASDRRAYWLLAGDTAGKRMTATAAAAGPCAYKRTLFTVLNRGV